MRLRVALLAVILLAPSLPAVSQEPLVIWTDQPEMAFVTEVFNVAGEEHAVVRFKESLGSAIATEEVDADVIIGEFINTPSVTGRLLALDDLVAQLSEVPLPALIESARHADTTRLVPLAYELPAILVNPRADVRLRDPFVSPEEILLNSGKFTRRRDERPTRVGFVPGYQPLARYYLLRLRGVEFVASLEREVRWDSAVLDVEVERLDQWSNAIIGSRDDETAFINRYLYDPTERQFERNRIAFAFAPSSQQLDWQHAVDAPFRWLASEENHVPILDTVVWAGIPAETQESRRALNFLEWLLDPETQEELLLRKIEHRISRFGLFGGFSSIARFNREVITKVYPELRGRIVPEVLLVAPPQLPRYWNETVTAVLVPLLNDAAVEPSELSGQLREAINTFYLQRGD